MGTKALVGFAGVVVETIASIPVGNSDTGWRRWPTLFKHGSILIFGTIPATAALQWNLDGAYDANGNGLQNGLYLPIPINGEVAAAEIDAAVLPIQAAQDKVSDAGSSGQPGVMPPFFRINWTATDLPSTDVTVYASLLP